MQLTEESKFLVLDHDTGASALDKRRVMLFCDMIGLGTTVSENSLDKGFTFCEMCLGSNFHSAEMIAVGELFINDNTHLKNLLGKGMMTVFI